MNATGWYFDKFHYVEEYEPSHRYIFDVACSICGEIYKIALPAQGLFELRRGVHIQDALPLLSADEREMLITGICGACWKRMFGEPEE